MTATKREEQMVWICPCQIKGTPEKQWIDFYDSWCDLCKDREINGNKKHLIPYIPQSRAKVLEDLLYKAKGLILVLAKNDKDFKLTDPWMEKFKEVIKKAE